MIDQAYAKTSVYCNARLRNKRKKQNKKNPAVMQLKTYDAKLKM